jgi:hypothetical protein
LAEDLLKRSNEAARDRADLSRLKEIATSLIMDSQEQQLDLTGSTRHMGQRRFVMEGVWIKGRQGRRITAFLFTDLLLLCEPARAQAGMYKPYLAVSVPLLMYVTAHYLSISFLLLLAHSSIGTGST